MYPVGDYAADTLQNQPDLYGPFWIATSVVFSVFVCSSLAGSLAAYIAGKPHVYDFTLLSFAVVVVYMYAFLCPALVWASTKYFGCQPSLLEIINYYGYGLTIWIPVSVSCRRNEVYNSSLTFEQISFCALFHLIMQDGLLSASPLWSLPSFWSRICTLSSREQTPKHRASSCWPSCWRTLFSPWSSKWHFTVTISDLMLFLLHLLENKIFSFFFFSFLVYVKHATYN